MLKLLALVLLTLHSLSLINVAHANDDQFTNAMKFEASKFDKFVSNKGLVYDDPKLQDYLQKIMDRLFPEYKGELNVHIHKAPILNAFALANGSIYINISMLAACENEAQIAAVLAHEGIHYVNQHVIQKQKHRSKTAGMELAVGALTGGVSLIFSGALANSAIAGYSRELETEADNEGFKRFVAAGYEVTESSKMFELLLEEVELYDIEVPYFYSSHPALKDRISNYESLAVKNSSGAPGITNGKIYNSHVRDARNYNINEKLNTGQYKGVINELTKLNRGKFYGPHYKYYIGEAYRLSADMKDLNSAESNYLASINDAPEFSMAYRSLGTLYFKQKRCYPAVTNFRRYLELEPHASDKSYVDFYIRKCEEGAN